MKRRRWEDPLKRLATAFGSAALNIESETYRRIAGTDAQLIPIGRAELGRGKKAEMARRGRRILAQLPTMPAEDRAQAASDLIDCKNAIRARFEVTHEITYRGRHSKSLTG